MRRSSAELPLHSGSAPRWLFTRMVNLAREICRLMVEFYGPCFLLERLSNPFWFQAFGSLLGFDWHSSGVTTTVCGALKCALSTTENDLGVFVAGGKGAASRRTPQQISAHSESAGFSEGFAERLIRISRLVAKVDSAAVQDGFQIYHHTFFFLADGTWCVVQQGMDVLRKVARRYHWHSGSAGDFLSDPHTAICCDLRKEGVLNLAAKESSSCRNSIVELATDPKAVLAVVERGEDLFMPHRHYITPADFNSKRLANSLAVLKDVAPRGFCEILLTRGVGARTLRALSLAAEVIFGTPPSFRDPARFAFAHGGKDGTPFPVDRNTYDETIEILASLTTRAKLPHSEKENAIKRLRQFPF